MWACLQLGRGQRSMSTVTHQEPSILFFRQGLSLAHQLGQCGWSAGPRDHWVTSTLAFFPWSLSFHPMSSWFKAKGSTVWTIFMALLFYNLGKLKPMCSASFFLLRGWPWLHVQYHRLHWEIILSRPAQTTSQNLLIMGSPHCSARFYSEWRHSEAQQSNFGGLHPYGPWVASGRLCLLGRPKVPGLFVQLCLLQAYMLFVLGRACPFILF